MVDGTPHLLSAPAGALLTRLADSFECVWCSGWEDRAEEHLPALLGLTGGWAHLSFAPAAAGVHWKLAAIDAFAGPQRPIAWIDDDHDDSCAVWAAQRPGPTRLVATEPAVGLTAAHVEELLSWHSEVAGRRPRAGAGTAPAHRRCRRPR